MSFKPDVAKVFYFLIVLLVGVVVYPAWVSMRDSAKRQTSKDHLRQIELALLNYHEQYKTFPPAFVIGPDGRRWHSWRVLILPQLGQQELAEKYRMDEPWDGPHNRVLISQCPVVFQSPFAGTESGKTNFYALIGRRSAWPAQHAISIDRALDGTSNTIHVVEAAPLSSWLEPHDPGVRDWINAFYQSDREGGLVTFMDGSVRFLSNKISRELLVSLITPRYGELMYSGPDWPADVEGNHDLGPVWNTQDVSALAATDVIAAARTQLDPRRNQIWCATFQLAWDELCDQLRGSARTTPSRSIVDLLNADRFNRQSLAPDTYLVSASGSGLAETRSLVDRVQQNFPQLIPQVESFIEDGNPDLRLYACLVKSLPFVTQMDRFPSALRFHDGSAATEVISFGRMAEAKEGLGEVVLRDQVVIGDYVSDDDFVIVLNSSSQQTDEIILARTAPGESLRSMWSEVDKRLQSPHPHRVHADLHNAERLEIPILGLGLSKRFEELEGLSVDNAPAANHIAVARESILFRLDERGAEIIAEAESMYVGENGFAEVPYDPTRPRRFVFDQPFFLSLREKGGSEPYFLAWIAHPEVMERYFQAN